ncbi:hypothetical protein EDF66_101713 [Sphingobacterium sp. JUb20]|nr:hypothetical protein [Sphingobacterium sp. JUb21]TCR10898.1 hypothetical protein EDF66_101713 [Sphingobacterium sp. JUb20]
MSSKFIANIRFLALQNITAINTPFFKITNHQHFKEECITDNNYTDTSREMAWIDRRKYYC